MRPGRRGASSRLAAFTLVLALAFVLVCQGCSEDRPAGDKDSLTGKTPVVRPEDVHGRGAGGAAVLAPDYRQGLSASLEADPKAKAARNEGAPLSDPATGRLFAGRPAGNTVPAAGPPPTASSMPAAGPSASGPGAAALAAPAQAAQAAPPATQTPPPRATAAAAPKGTAASGGTGATEAFPVAACRQLVLVSAKDFAATSGELRRFERSGPGAPWREAGSAVPCRLGRNGLGVGRGLVALADGPVKAQGDGRTPAGLFSLPEAFGYAGEEAARNAGVRLPYAALTDRAACVTEAASPLYGRVVGPGERGAGGAAGQERMVRDDRANVWGLVIGHNRDQPDPRAGTCLFLNVRPASGPPTGGSVGCPEEAAATLAAWLDPAAAPVLAVLPEAVYARERRAWGLP